MKNFGTAKARPARSRGRDLTGQKFGRLVALGRDRSITKVGAWWTCKCACGKSHVARADNLTQGLVQSCGCKRRDEGVRKMLAMHHKSAQKLRQSNRIADAWRAIFGDKLDEGHVDRPGARLVRGRAY